MHNFRKEKHDSLLCIINRRAFANDGLEYNAFIAKVTLEVAPILSESPTTVQTQKRQVGLDFAGYTTKRSEISNHF